MRVVLLLSWMLFILALSLTNNFKELIHHGEIYFSFTINPYFTSFFTIYQMNSSTLIAQKVGLFFFFIILTAILVLCLKSFKMSWFIGFSYGLATEVIQPFFFRSGRILDVLINWSGVLVCLFILLVINQFLITLYPIWSSKVTEEV
ncbi:VanZ family protein [Alkalihalobacillus sp. 1P02AB]|uniref:VanZ family protein n=1 Tax=Alkalihalobacillus sp. 1P02AB TaxID=3132260 RepID=UPI0039A6FB47